MIESLAPSFATVSPFDNTSPAFAPPFAQTPLLPFTLPFPTAALLTLLLPAPLPAAPVTCTFPLLTGFKTFIFLGAGALACSSNPFPKILVLVASCEVHGATFFPRLLGHVELAFRCTTLSRRVDGKRGRSESISGGSCSASMREEVRLGAGVGSAVAREDFREGIDGERSVVSGI